jgi:hypothetical protein
MRINKEEFVRRREEVYLKHNEELESKYSGMVLALHEDGIASLGDIIDAAYNDAVRKHPGKIFYFRRVGKFAASRMLFAIL